MKRGWFGAGLLLGLLLLGILSSRFMKTVHQPLSEALTQASDLALAGDWEQAAAIQRQAHAAWEDAWNFSAAFADHGPMEDIDSLFSQLEVYLAAGDRVGFSAACASLSQQIEAVGDAHELNWWNLL